MSNFETSISSTERVEIDKSTISAIGLHHSRVSALADLIDNSISASASEVRIRFLEAGNRILGLQVIDNGSGMNAEELRQAFTFGARRDYGSSDLGHFGLGLKSASLSQAQSFEVFTRRQWGEASGRRMDREVSNTSSVDVLEKRDAARKLDECPGLEMHQGTIVEWQNLLDVMHSDDDGDRHTWRNEVLKEVREHLGVTFHRFLRDGRLRISIDSLDVVGNRVLPSTDVDSIDPFENSVTNDKFPLSLQVALPDGEDCHIDAHMVSGIPGTPSFDLFGQPGGNRQGIYVYWRDRLLAPGGSWNGLALRRRELNTARLRIEIGPELEPHITLNSEKLTPTFSSDLIQSIKGARGLGAQNFTLRTYFSEVERVHRELKKPRQTQIHLVEPSSGISPGLLELLEELQDFSSVDPVDIRISSLPDDEFFRADRFARRVDLNANHLRSMYGLEGRLSNQSAQFVKVCVYFLVEDDFKREQRWSELREERHRLLNRALLKAVAEDTSQMPVIRRGNN